MAGTMKGKAEAAGHKIAEKANEIGHKVGEKVEEAADWAKEKAHQVGNRVEEAAQKAQHKAKETLARIEPWRDVRPPVFASTWTSSVLAATSWAGSITSRGATSS